MLVLLDEEPAEEDPDAEGDAVGEEEAEELVLGPKRRIALRWMRVLAIVYVDMMKRIEN